MDLRDEAAKAERIGVVGSPSSTSQLHLDIIAGAEERGLVGTIAFLRYRQDGADVYAIGHLSEVTLRNLFAEDHTMKSLTKQRGEVPYVTKSQDTHTAEMMVSAVFQDRNGSLSPGSFATVPPTGTPVCIITPGIMRCLVAPEASEVVHLGRVFGSDVLLPSWFRHFGAGDGGLGDAMHIGIFGKTGSGKSVLGRMILLSYVRQRSMSILVLDPQGEFARMGEDQTLLDFAGRFGKRLAVYDLSKLVLVPDMELFKRILIDSKFLKKLGIRAEENQRDAADEITKILEADKRTRYGHLGRIGLDRAYSRTTFDVVWENLAEPHHLGRIYAMNGQQYQRLYRTIKTSGTEEFFAEWKRVAHLFGRYGDAVPKISQLLKTIGEGDSITIINLSETGAPPDVLWNESVKRLVINQVLGETVGIAQDRFLEGGNLNTLVVLDEAHRFAPRRVAGGDHDENTTHLKNTLLDAVRTTRKFGLGWMFISQTLASLDQELIQQLRMYFFGYGLAWGAELRALNDLVGGNSSVLSLYQQFHDPASNLGGGVYSFMSVGPSSPLAFSGVPLFFNSLRFPDEFIKHNT